MKNAPFALPASTRRAATITPAPLAGMARLSTVARHWSVSPATAKTILRAAGIEPLRRGRGYYAWSSIWRHEGATEVEPAHFESYREPRP